MATVVEGCPDDDLTNEDLQDIHEDILDRNERGVRRIIREFVEQDLPTKRLCCTEVELEPASHDHVLNWLPLTALHRATLMDSHGILDAILTYVSGLDINQRLVKNGYTPLHVAASAGVLASVNYLTSSGACINSLDVEGATPIHLAAHSGHKDVMSLLCVRGASVTACDKNGQTPLHLASEAGQSECVDFILAKQVDVNAKDSDGKTALHVAQVKGHVDVTKKLLDKGALVNVKDEEANTPLHVWIKNNLPKLKELSALPKLTSFHYLLEFGCDVNSQDLDGNSGLHLVSGMANDIGLLDMLMNQGANVNMKNVIGRSPIFNVQSEWAFESLTAHGASCAVIDRDGNNVLHVFADNGDVTADVMMSAIDNGAHVNHPNKAGETALHRACLSGSSEKARRLLDSGAWNDVIDNRGRTILHLTLQNSHTDLSMWLLKQNNINITHQDFAGHTPFHLAASTGNKLVINHLIAKSIDINKKTSSGKTPATLAGEANHLESLRTILKNGGILDPEAATMVLSSYVAANDLKSVQILLKQLKGKSAKVKSVGLALHAALENKLLNIANLLLDYGADIDCMDQGQRCPLHIVCKNLPQMESAIPRVISKRNSVMADYDGFTALHYGICDCSISSLSLFLQNGFDVTLKNNQGKTVLHTLLTSSTTLNTCDKVRMLTRAALFDPMVVDQQGDSFLHLAVRSGGPQLVELILKTKPDVNLGNSDKVTPLHEACSQAQLDVVSLLLQGGAAVNIVDRRGRGPLFYAVSKASEEIAILLLQNGADIDQQDEKGKSSVMVALEEKHIELCSAMILEKNPDVTLCDAQGRNLAHYAAQYGTADIMETITALECDINKKDHSGSSPIHQVVHNRDVSIVKVMLSRGADINTQSEDGDTLLHLCARHDNYDHVTNLIDNGADIETRNKAGRTATHLAAIATDPDVIQLLVANEADIDALDCRQNTPLMMSIASGMTENSSVLLEQGADVSIINSDGDSALHIAARHPQMDKNFIKLLMSKSRNLMHKENKRKMSVLEILCERSDIDMETFSQELGLEL